MKIEDFHTGGVTRCVSYVHVARTTGAVLLSESSAFHIATCIKVFDVMRVNVMTGPKPWTIPIGSRVKIDIDSKILMLTSTFLTPTASNVKNT